MATEIRQQGGITIVEPSGKIVGTAVSEFREVLASQIEAFRCTPHPHQFRACQYDGQFWTGYPCGGTYACGTKRGSYRGR